MRFIVRQPGTALAAACGLALMAVPLVHAGVAGAQTYPTKPIRFIVPFAPGGGNDLIARLVGRKLTDSWSQQVVVDNRPGAGGNVAGEIVARSSPDGYTLFLFNTANAIAPSLYLRLPYDPVKDFAPITLIATSPFVLVVNPGTPAGSVGELIVLAKRQPGKLTYASGGNGSATHLAAELLKQLTQIELLHVPYKGAGPALVDLIAGQVALYVASAPAAMPHLKPGRVRALAVTGVQRSNVLPDLPTVAEAGVPGYEASVSYGVVAPARTPQDIIRKLNAELVRMLREAELNERLTSQGADVIASTPPDYTRQIKSEVAKWAKVVKLSGARVE